MRRTVRVPPRACRTVAVPSAGCGGQPGESEGLGPLGEDLYEWDDGRLGDRTVDEREPANVKGVIGASEDGEYVYFVAGGALAGSHPRGQGGEA
jgi:hypothetical protein